MSLKKGRSLALDKHTETVRVSNEVEFVVKLIECQIFCRNTKDKRAVFRRLCGLPVYDLSVPIGEVYRKTHYVGTPNGDGKLVRTSTYLRVRPRRLH